MTIQPFLANYYIIFLLFGALTAGVVVLFSLQHLDVPGAIYTAVLNIFVVLWLLLTIMDWNSSTTSLKLFWNQIGYICVGFLPLSWLAFTLKYTQVKWFKPIYLLIPSIIPLFVLYLAFNNRLWVLPIKYTYFGSYIYQQVTFTDWIYLAIAFAYANNVSGVFVILRALIKDPARYKKQAPVLLVGAISPLFLNIVYNFKIIPGWDIDLTPIGFTISGAAFTWALFRYRLLNLVPFARDMLIDTMEDGLIVLDVFDSIIDMNPAALKMASLERSAAIGLPLNQVIPVLKDLPGNSEIGLTVEQLPRYYEVKSSPLVNRVTHITEGRMLMLGDITRRKEFAHKLAQSEEMFRSVIEQSHDGMMLTNFDSRIIAWNQGMTHITGIPAEMIIGKNLWTLGSILHITDSASGITADTLREIYTALRKDIENGYDFDRPLEVRIQTLQGEERYIQIVSFPIRTSGSIIIGNIARDITQSKQNEHEIKRLYAEAKELQKQAEAASEAKSQFLAVMSHELRTPMNAVLGMIQLMMDTNLSQQQIDYAETIQNSGNTLLSIINDILDYTKIESGKMELEKQTFALRDVIEESLDIVSRPAAQKSLHLIYTIAPEVPYQICSDPTRLRQILINLLGNAVKFTHKGEVVLTVDAIHLPPGSFPVEMEDGCYCLNFSIRDTGIGILPEKLERLFKTFSQVDQSTTRVYGGTGLGLAISKRLVEAMQGNISVESEVGKGSLFYFSIQAEAATINADTLIEKSFKQIMQNKSVLEIGDSQNFLDSIAQVLNRFGILVYQTCQTDEALSILEQQASTFDLVLLDPTTLKKDAVNRLVKTLTLLQDIPLVLFNHQWNNALNPQLLKMSKAVIHKPVKYYALINTLQQVVSGKPLQTIPVKSSIQKQAVIGPDHPLRILMVEDNQVNQKVGMSLLERLGYRVAIASSGLEALALFKNRVFDVVFMDVQMADLDGLETTRRIRQKLPAELQPRIIALTAATSISDRTRCIDAGMNDYISKPIHLTEMANALLISKPISTFDPSEFVVEPFVQPASARSPVEPSPAIDSSVIKELLNMLGNQKWHTVQESILLFNSESGPFIQNLKQAMERGDAEQMHHLAHTLKSTAASVGAMTLSKHCLALDTDLRFILSDPQCQFPADRFEQNISLIQTEFQRACQELDIISQNLPEIAAQ
jgi:PAS domain S-box-containing protein